MQVNNHPLYDRIIKQFGDLTIRLDHDRFFTNDGIPDKEKVLLSHQALTLRRFYVINNIKDPLRKRIELAERFTPTIKKATCRNTLKLLEIRDKFNGFNRNYARRKMWAAAWKMFIYAYDRPDSILIKLVQPYVRKKIISLTSMIPEPNKINTAFKNSHILIDLREGLDPYWSTLVKLLIFEYDHDPYYRFRFDWFIEKCSEVGWMSMWDYPTDYRSFVDWLIGNILKSNWIPRPIGWPTQDYWSEWDDMIKSGELIPINV